MPDALPDGLVREGMQESCTYLGSRVLEVEPSQPGIRLAPYWFFFGATRLDGGSRHLHAGMGENKIGAVIAPLVTALSPGQQLLRIILQQQFKEARLLHAQ